MTCTALGKVLLAYSPPDLLEQVIAAGLPRMTPRTIITPGVLRRELLRVLDTGLAYEREESAVGVASVAAPVFDVGGGVAAAISVTGALPRFSPAASAHAVRAAGRQISRALSAARGGAPGSMNRVGS